MATSISKSQTLHDLFVQAVNVYKQEAIYLPQWQQKLSGPVTAMDGVAMANNIVQASAVLNAAISAPGMNAYAQFLFGDSTLNFTVALQNLVTALANIKTWLDGMAANAALTPVNGQITGATFTPAQTAPLLTLVQTAAATLI